MTTRPALPALTALCLVAALAAPLPAVTGARPDGPAPSAGASTPAPAGAGRAAAEAATLALDLRGAHRLLRLRGERAVATRGRAGARLRPAAAVGPAPGRAASLPAPPATPTVRVAVPPAPPPPAGAPAVPPPAPVAAPAAAPRAPASAESPVAVVPDPDGTVPLDPAAADGLHRRAADALALISYPWPQLGYEIVFSTGRPGMRARVTLHARRIEVFVRPSDSVRQIAFFLAHEIAHAFDFQRGTGALRATWQQARGIDAGAPWFGCNACPDLATPAGDFAESFAAWQVPGGDFGSRLGPPPDDAHKALLAALTAP